MIRTLTLLAVLCVTASTADAQRFDPTTYGAIADDGIDDTRAFQTAVDAACLAAAGGKASVYVPDGRWTLTKAGPGAYNRTAAIALHCAHVAIGGPGILSVGGDQLAGSTIVIALDPGARDIDIHDLTIDTSGAFNTDEQFHAIATTGNCNWLNGTCGMTIEDVRVRNVRFIHPRPAIGRKGDCIRLLGNTVDTAVVNFTVIGSTFADCARSDLVLQRNVRASKVIGNHFGSPTVDQHVDGEASGGEWDDGLILAGNTFACSLTQQGDYDVALTSFRKAIVAENLFCRGLYLYRTMDSIVANNIFEVTFKSSYGVIETGNVSDGNQITNNIIRRHGVPGPGIRSTPHSGGFPGRMKITGNSITLDGDSTGIRGESLQDTTIEHNSVYLTGAAPNGGGVSLQAAQRALTGVRVRFNDVVSSSGIFAAVRLSASPYNVDGAAVVGNTSRALSGQSFRCDASLGAFGPIAYSLNEWHQAPTCGAALSP